MNVVKIFQDGETQVVRLPEQFNFNDDKVFIKNIAAQIN
jgi:virulence-associated protein VagC